MVDDVIVGQESGATGTVVEHYGPNKPVKGIGRPLELKRVTHGFRVQWDRADRKCWKIHDFNFVEGWLLEPVGQ
jgi:hypothetical protein